MPKPVSTLHTSEVGKDVTKRARALNQALDLAGPRVRQAKAKALRKVMQAEHEAMLPQPKYAWLDAMLKK
jgi:hypothetical protein